LNARRRRPRIAARALQGEVEAFSTAIASVRADDERIGAGIERRLDLPDHLGGRHQGFSVQVAQRFGSD